MYETTRDGVKERYQHDFSSAARPRLVASSDGRLITLVGDKYQFTELGIVDKP